MVVGLYHKFLRVNAVIVLVVLVFDGGFVLPITKQLSDNAIEYLANPTVGVFAGVPPNELNTITAELTAKEKALNDREAALQAREIKARDYGVTPDYSTYILSAILFILTTLIVLNYALDWARERKIRNERQPA